MARRAAKLTKALEQALWEAADKLRGIQPRGYKYEELGLREDEVAFYDAIVQNDADMLEQAELFEASGGRND